MIGTMTDIAVSLASRWAAASTPTPAPKVPNADLVTPGFWGFMVIFLIAIVTILLVLDMTRRIRRTRYRDEIAAKLDAEQIGDVEDPFPPETQPRLEDSRKPEQPGER